MIYKLKELASNHTVAVLGLNVGAGGVTTLTEIELFLKVILLIVSITLTALACWGKWESNNAKRAARKLGKPAECGDTDQFIPLIILGFLLFFSPGCSQMAKQIRGKGGAINHQSASGTHSKVTAPQDPKSAATVHSQSKMMSVLPIPAGTRLQFSTPQFHSRSNSTNSYLSMILDKDTVFTSTFQEDVKISTGAAQKNNIGETVAKLESAKGLMWAGGLFILIGLAIAFVPYLRALAGGGMMFGLVTAGAGGAIIALPYIVIGNEQLIIWSLVLGAGVVGYLFVIRHGKKAGKVEVYKEFIDQNKNGIDDRKES